jgi:hypothetical protein
LRRSTGTYSFTFELDAAGDLAGSAQAPGDERELWVGLVYGSGEPIHLRVGDSVQPWVPIGSAGAFALRAVPCGDLEAWFGERAALEAGRPDLATRVVAGPGESPPLVVGPSAVDPRHAPARKGV